MMAANNRLTVPDGLAYGHHQSRTQSGAGFGDPRPEAQSSRATLRRGFFVSSRNVLSWAGRMGDSNVCRSSGRFANLYGSAHPFGDGGAEYTDRNLRTSTMAIKATSTGAIRPESTYTYVSASALEKRIRRHLAKQAQSLIKARPDQIDQIGIYAICGTNRHITRTHVNLASLARELGVLGEHERLDHSGLGWVWAVARRREVREDGKLVSHHDQLTREFATEQAARRAAALIEDQGDLVIVGWNAGRTPA